MAGPDDEIGERVRPISLVGGGERFIEGVFRQTTDALGLHRAVFVKEMYARKDVSD
jgi:hypothetical protein